MADCRLMLDFNGANNDTWTLDRTGRHGTITFNGTADIITDTPKFGVGCLYLDGNSDYLSIANSVDWNVCASASDDWTIDLFVKHGDHVGTEVYLCQSQDTSNYWQLQHVHGSGLRFVGMLNGVEIITTGYGGEITDTEWHHIAMCKVGDEYGIYLDCVQVVYVQDSSEATIASSLFIGAFGTPSSYFYGRMDQIRIDKSNHFNAAPNVGLTDTIDVINSVAHYPLNDDAATTTVEDISGNAYDGTLTGGNNTEDLSEPGLIDKGQHLDGSADYVNTGQDFEETFKDSFSIGVILRPDDGVPASENDVWGVYDSASGGDGTWLILRMAGSSWPGRLQWAYAANGNTGNNAMTDNPVFSDGPATEFTYVMCVFDADVGGIGGKKIYINGVEVDLDSTYNGSTAGVTPADYVCTRDMLIGSYSIDGTPVAGEYFDGLIEDWVLIPKALSAAEVLDFYNKALERKRLANMAYQDYELLPVFPNVEDGDISRGIELTPFTDSFNDEAVLRSSLSDGRPITSSRFDFQPRDFGIKLTYVSDTDKATLFDFYSNYAGRDIAFYNPTESLKYHVVLTETPMAEIDDEKGFWNLTFKFKQVSSTTWS